MTGVGIIQYLTGGFFIFYLVLYSTLLHLPAPDSTVSEDAEIEPRTGATLELTVRRSNHSARSQPQLGYTVLKMDLILCSIQRRPQMQFSMGRKFTLWRYADMT